MARRLPSANCATIAEVFADGVAVADAAASACRNRSLPAHPRKRRARLPASNAPNALKETNAPNEVIGPSGRNFPIVVDDPNARREPTGRSALNTDRRRDISP
jgi:hypothetical protein